MEPVSLAIVAVGLWGMVFLWKTCADILYHKRASRPSSEEATIQRLRERAEEIIAEPEPWSNDELPLLVQPGLENEYASLSPRAGVDGDRH